MNNKKKINYVAWITDILGFSLVLGGVLLVRFSDNLYISIMGGILATIGVGLLFVSRLLLK